MIKVYETFGFGVWISRNVFYYMRSSMLFLLPASDISRGRYDGFEVVGLLLSSLVIVALIT